MLDLGNSRLNRLVNSLLEKPDIRKNEVYRKLRLDFEKVGAIQEGEIRQGFLDNVLDSRSVVGTETWNAIDRFRYTPVQVVNPIHIAGLKTRGFRDLTAFRSDCFSFYKKILVNVYDAAFKYPKCLDDFLSSIDHEASHCSYYYHSRFIKSKLPKFVKDCTKEEDETLKRFFAEPEVTSIIIESIGNMDMIEEINNGRRIVSKWHGGVIEDSKKRVLEKIKTYVNCSGVAGRWMKELEGYLKASNCLLVKPAQYAGN